MSETGERREQTGEFELDLSKIGLLIIIPVGFWAYYTTFRGMLLLTRGEQTGQIEIIFGTIGAFIGSAAILVLLALTSWILGADLAASFSNQRRPDSSTRRSLILMISAFAFFFVLSVFFSYTYYHNNFFHLTSELQLAINQPGEFNNAIMEPLRDTLKKNDAAVSKNIRDSDKAWAAAMSELITLAGEKRDTLRQGFEEHRKTTAKQQTEILAKAKDAERRLKDNRTRRAEVQTEIDRLNQIMKPNLDEIERLKTEAEDFDRQAAEARQGLDTTKKAACGPICLKFQGEAARVRKEIKKHEAVLAPRRKELARLLAEARKLDDEVPNLQKSIDEARALDPAAAGGDASASFLDPILQALRLAHDSPTWENIRAARPRCEQLIERIRAGKIALKIAPDFNCVPGAQTAQTLLDERDKVLANRVKFDMECSETVLRSKMADISQQVQLEKIKSRDSLQQARVVIQNCVALAVPAGLTGAQEGQFLRLIADHTRQNPLAVNVFDRARNALFAFDGDARIAIAIAFAQDMLILVFRFVAENYRYRSRRRRDVELARPIDLSDDVGDDPQIRAWKALLRLARPGDSDTSRLSEADVAAQGFEPGVLANLHATLNNIGIQGGAWSDRKGVIVIENSAIRAIDRELRAIEGQRATDFDQIPDTVERLPDDRRAYAQGGDGIRRPLPAGPTQNPSTPQAPTDTRLGSRSARRGRLRELITGSHEPQSERPRPKRQEPAPPTRLRPAQSTQKPTDFTPEPASSEVRSPEPAPAHTPASQNSGKAQPDNPFDYLSRFSQTDKKGE